MIYVNNGKLEPGIGGRAERKMKYVGWGMTWEKRRWVAGLGVRLLYLDFLV
jgi:hypothetical protein